MIFPRRTESRSETLTDTLWILIAAQIAMGGFDTLYHHEEPSASPGDRPSDPSSGCMACATSSMRVPVPYLGWPSRMALSRWLVMRAAWSARSSSPSWDFVEEDHSPAAAGERAGDPSLLALNYGAILALLRAGALGLGRPRHCAPA